MRFFNIYALLTISISFFSCNKDKDNLPVPEVLLGSSAFSVSEDSPQASADIPVTLSAVYDKQVTVEYTTSDSTAVAGKDYTEIRGIAYRSGNKIVLNPPDGISVKIEELSLPARYLFPPK